MEKEKKKFFRLQIDPNRLPEVVQYKWSKPLLEEGIAAIPKKFLRTAHQIFQGQEPLCQFQVAMTLADYKRPNLNRYPTVAFLAYLSGLSKDQFERNLSELESQGLVKVTRVKDAIDFDLEGLRSAIGLHAQSVWEQLDEGGR